MCSESHAVTMPSAVTFYTRPAKSVSQRKMQLRESKIVRPIKHFSYKVQLDLVHINFRLSKEAEKLDENIKNVKAHQHIFE